MNYGLIFLTGLTTGGISCAAIQGGLLATVIANNKKQSLAIQLLGFLGAKLIVYTLFGIVLGALGSAFQLNQTVILGFQAAAALYIIATALNLLEIHPLFRYVVIQPPKQFFRLTKNTTKLSQWYTPVLLGIATILIPCGVTQAMEITAISSGNPLTGGLVLFSFVLGTMPLFILIGLGLKSLSAYRQQLLYKAAAVLLILLGLSSLNGVATALDLPVSVNAIFSDYQKLKAYETNSTQIPVKDGVQKVIITVTSHGYSPKYFQVKKGISVQLDVVTQDSYSCANYFTFRSFGISARLDPNDHQSFTFTPEKSGKYIFSCSMGMYSGTMEVVD